MTDDVLARKTEARGLLRARLAAVPATAWDSASRLACALLRGRPEWAAARSVLLYYPMPREIDLRPVLREALEVGRLVALPRYCRLRGDYEAAAVEDGEQDVQPGWAGIPEPGPACAAVPLNQLDLVLVPGLGFTADGRRLGRGRGFYDRLLRGVRGIRCGVAGEWQLLDAIPTQPHDERVDYLLTPTRWIDCRPRAV